MSSEQTLVGLNKIQLLPAGTLYSTAEVVLPIASNAAHISKVSPAEHWYCESFTQGFKDKLSDDDVSGYIRENLVAIKTGTYLKTIDPHMPLLATRLVGTSSRPDGPKANHALTIEPIEVTRTDQRWQLQQSASKGTLAKQVWQAATIEPGKGCSVELRRFEVGVDDRSG